jgi:xanthosine phosphorylase
MMVMSPFKEAFEFMEERAKGFRAKVGIATGSNLADLVDSIENQISIPYDDIPGVVTAASVEGHTHSRIVLGELHGVPVACLQGRLHRYEGIPYQSMQILFNLLKYVGCESILIANASGSLRENVGAGELVVVNDHINLSFGSPLAGPNDEAIGPRFLSLTNTYDKTMRDTLKEVASGQGVELHEGVYMGVSGPLFETPAEVKMFAHMGADIVGMSTIPDVVFSHHCGMKVAVVAAVVNLAAGIVEGVELSHEETLHQCELASNKMTKLFSGYIQLLGEA